MSLPRFAPPSRGDLVAGGSVALILVPQSLAYAQLAGLPPVHGLYAAAAAPVLAALAGSSPYLQTGPVAMTSLLTLGALSPLAATGSAEFVGYAALLAVVVGCVRALLALLRAGAFAYLLSEPALHGFTVAGALLIIASQVPPLLDHPATSANPLVSAGAALGSPGRWELAAVALGLATVLLLVLARRAGPLFPGVPLVAGAGLLIGGLTAYPGELVGAIPTGLPSIDLGLAWSALPQLLLPGAVIAVIGFAEAVAISRRYAGEERQRWEPNRELLGQGLANIASGFAGGYPTGGSLSRSALNRAAGATSRWSGALTGLLVLCALPVAGVLAPLPRSVLAGLVVAATLSLLDVRVFARHWRLSPLQACVAGATFAATLAFAPRIERGVMVGVALAIAVHLWRELRLDVETAMVDGRVLHVWPQGVLYYASAPALQDRVVDAVARHPAAEELVLHLSGLGRIDLSGMLAVRALLSDTVHIPVTVADVPAHGQRLVTRVLPLNRVAPPGSGSPAETSSGGAPLT
jgi:SulP family sulfate permease